MIFVANRTCGAILGARQFAYLPRICVQRSRACSKISISDPRRHGQRRWHKCAPMSVRFGGSIGRKSPNASTKTAASKLTRPNSITAIRDAGGNIWLPCLTPGRQSPVIGNGIERQRTVRNRAHQSCGERIDARPRHRNELRQGRSAILCAKVCRYQRVGELR